ncbi:hypothetical protein C900_00486 [Fulvivirga imtechensis AK7]|uniref:Uncharacterized protein n=1 Tax=Fulvivirga imtechensis AK7 TaxID=1237149 RepID=L8JZA0_9BACT|nr:hypothetical protein C900_00486 [Fulvivirga imtechensis AK7]
MSTVSHQLLAQRKLKETTLAKEADGIDPIRPDFCFRRKRDAVTE